MSFRMMSFLKKILPLLLLLSFAVPHGAMAAPLPLAATAGQTAAGQAAAAPAIAPSAAGGLNISLDGSGLFTDRMVQIIALITVLSIAPSIIIMMTSFVRIVVVLSLLRTALGLQQS
ncbi:MAG TPA: hypothetical protein VL133_03135, partial [Devosia sp.]|nr:hypothetical protein [Devosia sp.]